MCVNVVWFFNTFSRNHLHMYSPIFRVNAEAPKIALIYVGVFLVLSKISQQKSHQYNPEILFFQSIPRNK